MSTNGDHEWSGLERRSSETNTRKFKRYIFYAWVVVFSVAIMYAIHDSRSNAAEASRLAKENAHRIAEIRDSKATVKALQRTNCGLLKFLLTARKARWDAYTDEHNPHRQDDLRAVIGYENLARPFVSDGHATGYCPVSKNIEIKSRPLTTRGG